VLRHVILRRHRIRGERPVAAFLAAMPQSKPTGLRPLTIRQSTGVREWIHEAWRSPAARAIDARYPALPWSQRVCLKATRAVFGHPLGNRRGFVNHFTRLGERLGAWQRAGDRPSFFDPPTRRRARGERPAAAFLAAMPPNRWTGLRLSRPLGAPQGFVNQFTKLGEGPRA